MFIQVYLSSSDRLSAQDILTVRKVLEYLYPKVFGEEGKLDKDGTKIDCTDCLELLCNEQVRECMQGRLLSSVLLPWQQTLCNHGNSLTLLPCSAIGPGS